MTPEEKRRFLMLQNDPDVNPWHPDSSRNRRGSNMLRNPNQMQQIPRGVQQATIDAKYGKKHSSYRAGSPIKVPLPLKDEF